MHLFIKLLTSVNIAECSWVERFERTKNVIKKMCSGKKCRHALEEGPMQTPVMEEEEKLSVECNK